MADGWAYKWDVFRDKDRTYLARVSVTDPNGGHLSFTKVLDARPADLAACEAACSSLIPQMLRTMKNLQPP
jgi:hypothetical protein